MDDLLQMLSPGERRRNGDAWAAAQEAMRVQLRRVRGQEDADKNQDRLVPQVFPAKITLATAQTALSSSRHWWLYEWQEVDRDASGGGWTVLTNGRTNSLCGDAWNVYETTVDDNGGNIVSESPTRLAHAVDSVVTMNIDPNGRPWFDRINPVELC